MILASFLFILNLNVERQDISVQILSKHLRLLREAGSGSLEMMMPASRLVQDGMESGIFPEGKLRLLYRNKQFCLTDPSGRDITCREMRIFPAAETGEWSIVIDGIKRRYPLPVIIRSGNSDPVITISEDISRYSIDSAIAEYGTRTQPEMEAVYALAHLIRARTIDSLRNPHHGNDHFCDLTHCQVYRGRISSTEFTDSWDIRPGKESPPFLFHACCGGITSGPSVFTNGMPGKGVRDMLVSTGENLCGNEQKWQRRIKLSELLADLELSTDRKPMLKRTPDGISIRSATGTEVLPLESFRLAVNRKRGWSFLRSNTYTLKILAGADGQIAEFDGIGLGHGVGLCQEGALELSRRGFSRYEILCHYFPGIKKTCDDKDTCPELSWFRFDLEKGIITGGDQFLLRRDVAPGSLSKLLVALYLAERRPDLLQNYRYTCTGGISRNGGTEVCWERDGHGEVDLQSALKSSCNLYFYSLYDKIDYKDYARFTGELLKTQGVNLAVPVSSDPHVAARRLAGLDFSISWKVRDMMMLACHLSKSLIFTKGITMNNDGQVSLPSAVILKALHETVSGGTASGREKRQGYMELLPSDDEELDGYAASGEYWGKTSTVIHGSNDPGSYGIFLGGNKTEGIFTLLKGGSGHCAARWALHLLRQEKK